MNDETKLIAEVRADIIRVVATAAILLCIIQWVFA